MVAAAGAAFGAARPAVSEGGDGAAVSVFDRPSLDYAQKRGCGQASPKKKGRIAPAFP